MQEPTPSNLPETRKEVYKVVKQFMDGEPRILKLEQTPLVSRDAWINYDLFVLYFSEYNIMAWFE